MGLELLLCFEFRIVACKPWKQEEEDELVVEEAESEEARLRREAAEKRRAEAEAGELAKVRVLTSLVVACS